MSRCVASAQLGLSSALVGPVPARPTRLHTGSSAIWLGKVGIFNILWRLPTDAVWVRFCDTGSSGEWGPEVGRKRGRDWGYRTRVQSFVDWSSDLRLCSVNPQGENQGGGDARV